MTQSQPNAGPHDAVPAPTFFDPSFERLPAPVSGDTAAAGPLLLVFDRGADRDWAADAAVALATGWHAAGRRTVLADLCLEDPFLNERIGMPNQEGVVDIFLYGASLARSARAVPGRGFYLISAGTYTPDPGAVLRNARWDKIVGGFRDNQAALLLFVPSDAPELPALRQWVSEVILLGGGDGAGPLPASGDFGVRAWLAPPRRDEGHAHATPGARPASPADRFPEPEPVSPWNAPPGTRAELNVVPPPADATVPGAVPASAIPVPEADWEREEAPAKKKRAVSPLLLILLLLALVAALLFLGPQYIPGFPNLLASSGAPRATPVAAEKAPPRAAPVPAGPVTAAGVALPYSVHVAGYTSWDEASRFAATTSRRFSEAKFFIVPELRGDRTYWLVMAGMAGDTSAVRALRDRLVAEKVADEESVGGRYDLIQHRPLAFEIGEFRNAAQAQARVDSLNTRAIPAYVEAVPYSDGSERWKVYAGAYGDSASSAPLREMLTGASIEPKLVERTGRPPASPK
jgi:cell division septation protein DedD